jgi:ABC-type oligopeptide transport system substrate-binding subunit
MKKFLLVLFLLTSALVLVACNGEEPVPTTPSTEIPVADLAPILSGVTDAVINLGDEFNVRAGVTATDAVDGNLTSQIKVWPTSVDSTQLGETAIFYSVTDSKGQTTTAFRVVTVALREGYAQGSFNFKFETDELRHTFFAAAEKWLLDSGAAGVPLFANAGFSMFSDRMSLVSQVSLPVMGFGTAFSTMTADDSTVTVEGVTGQVGKYTYRAALGSNPRTFNAWLANDSVSSDAIAPFLAALYGFKFNNDKTGYVLTGDLASGDPVPVAPELLDSGTTISKIWRVPVRAGLKWSFHPSVDTTGLDLDLTADDFLNTYKHALDNNWFRARTGGGHFWNPSNEIVGAKAYYDAPVAERNWSSVGLRKYVDPVTSQEYLEYEFVVDMSSWGVRYWLSSNSISPINLSLYNREGVGSTYGTTPEKTAYYGPYILTYYEASKVLRYEKNPNYYNPTEYFYTGYNYQIITTDVLRWAAFVAGDLDAVGVPTTEFDNVKNDPRLKRVTGATTFRLGVNALKTKEAQEALFPAAEYGDWMPKPILGYPEMQKALYFAIDRQYLAYEVMKTSEIQQYHFTPSYLVNPESNVPFRDAPEAALVDVGLSKETHGFSKAAAQAWYLAAVEKARADGYYLGGTAASPINIELTLVIQANSVAQVNLSNYLKETFEDTFQDTVNHVYIKLTTIQAPFPDNYYSHALIGQFDLVVGGISGSTLDAASFLDVYASDNRGGFTFAWGFDTSVAEIEVTYDWYGETITEFWSFDAIASALMGEIYLVDGAEATKPE